MKKDLLSVDTAWAVVVAEQDKSLHTRCKCYTSAQKEHVIWLLVGIVSDKKDQSPLV